MLVDGRVWELTRLVPRTEERDGGVWPTPRASGGTNYKDANAERDAKSVDLHAKLGGRVTEGHRSGPLFVRVGGLQDHRRLARNRKLLRRSSVCRFGQFTRFPHAGTVPKRGPAMSRIRAFLGFISPPPVCHSFHEKQLFQIIPIKFLDFGRPRRVDSPQAMGPKRGHVTLPFLFHPIALKAPRREIGAGDVLFGPLDD